MIIMSFVEMMVGTAQNIINYLLLLLYIVNCSKFIWFFDLIWFDLIWSLQHCCLRWYYTGTVSIWLCGSDLIFSIFLSFYNTKTPLFQTAFPNVWQIFFSISSMMLTISLTSKADFFIYKIDYFVLPKYSSQLFWLMLVVADCLLLSFSYIGATQSQSRMVFFF